MNLAAVVLISVSCITSISAGVAGTKQQSSSSGTPENAAQSQDQGTTSPAAQNSSTTAKPATTPEQKSSAQEPSAAKKSPPHKKKVVAANCNSAAPTAGSAAADSVSTAAKPTDSSAAAKTPASPPGTSSASSDCLPSKVIVRQGGASEPSIELEGGPAGAQASRERATANQMLASTEENLKKIAGRQLDANQKDTVNQIHGFMEQSKTAVEEGDLERARTLAWKAQLLSEELVKP